MLGETNRTALALARTTVALIVSYCPLFRGGPEPCKTSIVVGTDWSSRGD